jgi:hypothetical protein
MVITEAQQETIDWIKERHGSDRLALEELPAQNVVVCYYQQEHPTGADILWIVRVYPDGLVSAKSLQS